MKNSTVIVILIVAALFILTFKAISGKEDFLPSMEFPSAPPSRVDLIRNSVADYKRNARLTEESRLKANGYLVAECGTIKSELFKGIDCQKEAAATLKLDGDTIPF